MPQGGAAGRTGPRGRSGSAVFSKKIPETFGGNKIMRYFCTRKTGTKAAQPARFLRSRHSGCSSVRLEYASGGRGVAGSSPVTPTVRKSGDDFSSPSPLFSSVRQGAARLRNEFEPYERRYQRKEEKQAKGRRRLAKHENAQQDGPHGADAGPDGVGRTDGQRLHRLGQQPHTE